jgi:hypothetical protein
MKCSKGLIPFFIALFALFLAPLSINAQGYGIAAGLRVGNGIGISYQHQIAHNTTIEGILQRQTSTSINDATLNVLYEAHKNVLTKGLNIYAGGGVYYTWINRSNLTTETTNPFGISPIAGAELTIGKFNVSIDFKPTIKLAGGKGVPDIKGFDMQSAFTVRYVLAGRFYKNDGWMFWKKWKKK